MAAEIPYPNDDILFVQDDVYRYGVLDELAATAYYAGKPHLGYSACKKLIDENLIPESERQRITENLKSYERVLTEIHVKEADAKISSDIKKTEEKKIEKERKRNTPNKTTKTKSLKKKYKTRKK